MLKKRPARFIDRGQVRLVEYPVFDHWGGGLTAAYSTRYGGVSEGVYSAMNLSFDRGDPPENVLMNYRLFARAAGADLKDLVLSRQKHTANIRMVTADDPGKGVVRERDYDAVDGLVTNIPGIALVTLHADCAPVYIYDPVHQAIGLCHAGWKGTALEISGKMIDLMSSTYGSEPGNMVVAVGPAVCGDCYAVGEDVIDAFRRMSIDAGEFIRYNKRTHRYFPDIALINGKITLSKGVKEENILVTDICTMENSDIFFSHRAHGDKRGSQAAIMRLDY